MVLNTEVGVEREGDESKYSGQPERWKRPCTKQKDERSIKWQGKTENRRREALCRSGRWFRLCSQAQLTHNMRDERRSSCELFGRQSGPTDQGEFKGQGLIWKPRLLVSTTKYFFFLRK